MPHLTRLPFSFLNRLLQADFPWWMKGLLLLGMGFFVWMLPFRLHSPSPSQESLPPAAETLSVQMATEPRVQCAVQRVIDGDTFSCRPIFKDVPAATSIKVRLLLVDTPEVHASHRNPSGKPQPGALEAMAFSKAHLSGKEVSLIFDVKRKDRYGRYLAWVFPSHAPASMEALKAHPNKRVQSLNYMLIHNKLATIMFYRPNVALLEELSNTH